MNCDVSEVRPVCHVLPWKADNEEESPLAKLPDEIFSRFLSGLDTIDIFRMTLVCRKWKSLIYDNSRQLKRAEHAVTTHLITFTDWMDPPSTCAKQLTNHFEFCCRDSTLCNISTPISIVQLVSNEVVLRNLRELGNLDRGSSSILYLSCNAASILSKAEAFTNSKR